MAWKLARDRANQSKTFRLLSRGLSSGRSAIQCSEAAYVLDGLYGHESQLEIEEHYVDTGGANDHVFGSFAVLGKRFAPRLRDLKDWRLHAFEDVGVYPLLKRHIGDRVDAAAIREGSVANLEFA